MYAIENGPSGFDPAAPALSPQEAVPDADAERAAGDAATPRFDDASHTLTIRGEGREAARGDLRTPEGRAAIEAFFAASAPTNCAGRRRCCTPTATASRTWPRKVVSIINLASVAALEDAVGAPVHPLRFRANLYVDGWPAWHEFDLLGRGDRDRRRRG